MAESSLPFLLTPDQHHVNDIFCVWDVSDATSANENNSCCEASHHRNFGSTGHDVLCEYALLFISEQTMFIPPVPDQDLHVTLSEARMREDGHKARQQSLTTQTVCILQHKELGQMHVGGLRFKVYPHQTNLKNLQVNSAASTAPRAFPPRMRRRQLRANFLYRITLSHLQFSNASLAQPHRNTCVPHSQVLSSLS